MARVACPSISKWRFAVIIKIKVAYQPEPQAYQPRAKPVAQAHFYSYCHFWQTQSKHGVKFLGGAADNKVCICIPRNPHTKNEQKKSTLDSFFSKRRSVESD
jgi:hypothetical protein